MQSNKCFMNGEYGIWGGVEVRILIKIYIKLDYYSRASMLS